MNIDSIVKVKVYFFKKGMKSYHSLVEDLVWLGHDCWENFTEDIVTNNNTISGVQYINDYQFVTTFEKDLVFIEDCFAFEFDNMSEEDLSGIGCEIDSIGTQDTFGSFKEMLIDLAKKVHEEKTSQKKMMTNLQEMLEDLETNEQSEILTVTMLTLWNYRVSRSYYDEDVEAEYDLIGIMNLSPLRIRSVNYINGELVIGSSNV